MATNIESQNAIFSLIGAKLKEKVKALVIGGSAMLYFWAKDVTKDIDLVLLKDEDRDRILKVLRELGYKERDTKFLYKSKRDVPMLLQRGEDRFDLFNRKIINFRITDSITERARQVFEYGKMIVHVVSPEDIILLKSATERAGDRKDAAEIMRRFSINWGIIIEESIRQMKIHGDLFPMDLYTFMEELKEDFGAEIPDSIMKKLEEIALEEGEKKLKSGKSVKVTYFGRKRGKR